MQLTTIQVRAVAKLARIRLTVAEVEKFTTQLRDIVGFVEKLNELDTANVPETNQVTGLASVLREDEPQPFGRAKELLATSEQTIENNQIKVKKSI